MTARHVRARLAAPAVLTALAIGVGCSRTPPPRPEVAPRAVVVEVVEPGPHRPSIALLGRVLPAELVPLTVGRAGTVAYPDRFPTGLRTGAAVEEGEVLARCRDEQARLAVAEAQVELERTAAHLDARRRAYEQGLLSELEYLDTRADHDLAARRLEGAREAVRELVLRAPRSGVLVVDEAVPAGARVEAGRVLGHLAAAGAPRVEAWASAADRPRIAVGLDAGVAPAGRSASASAVVLEVAPVVGDNGTVRVVLGVTDATGLPAPGEGVDVRVQLPERSAALTLPEAALVAGDGGSAVFLVEPTAGAISRGFQARRVSVEPGVRGEGRVEILRGLSDGDRVVVAGAAFLSDGDIVQPTSDEGAGGRQ